MVTPQQAYQKYGDPAIRSLEGKYMTLWTVPAPLRQGAIPSRIYCNKDMIAPLSQAFSNLINRNHIDELKTWDGCFNVRKQRGSISAMSLHSWGIAIDVNAATNGLGQTPTLSPGFVKCFTDAGFDWGANWARKDGMHFQLSKI